MSKFLRRSLLIFIIKVFWTIVFIFIVISTTFRPICPSAFFRCLSNSGTFTELRTTSFIETTGGRLFWFRLPWPGTSVKYSSILLACSEDWTCNLQMIVFLVTQGTNDYNCYAMCPAGQFRVNFWRTIYGRKMEIISSYGTKLK